MIKFSNMIMKKVENTNSNDSNNDNSISYDQFEHWLDSIVKSSDFNGVVATNFNLYEDGNDFWSIEFVATSRFDINDSDWACYEIFSSRDNPLRWQKRAKWEEILASSVTLIEQYLTVGKYAGKLKSFEAVGVGFVDGDIKILYHCQ
jgi:hypothetical protein